MAILFSLYNSLFLARKRYKKTNIIFKYTIQKFKISHKINITGLILFEPYYLFNKIRRDFK